MDHSICFQWTKSIERKSKESPILFGILPNNILFAFHIKLVSLESIDLLNLTVDASDIDNPQGIRIDLNKRSGPKQKTIFSKKN